PEPLLSRRNESVQRASLAHNGSNFRGRLHQHANFLIVKEARLVSLHDEDTLQNAPMDKRYSEKRMEGVFAGLAEVLESWMILNLLHIHRPQLFRNESREPLVESEPEIADALGTKTDGCGQDKVRAVRFQQVRRADIGPKTSGDQPDDVHQRFGRLAALPGQVPDLFESQNMTRLTRFRGWIHRIHSTSFRQKKSRKPSTKKLARVPRRRCHSIRYHLGTEEPIPRCTLKIFLNHQCGCVKRFHK